LPLLGIEPQPYRLSYPDFYSMEEYSEIIYAPETGKVCLQDVDAVSKSEYA
jgi:hypothetical protein